VWRLKSANGGRARYLGWIVRYRNRRPDDAPLRVRLRELAGQRRRFGYRRLHILMIWEGLHMNHKKLRRLYREEGLQVRRRGGRKRALGTRAPMQRAIGFYADQFKWRATTDQERKQGKPEYEVVPTTRTYYPPDVAAQRYWANNRMRDKWTDVSKVEVATKRRSSDEKTNP
jgi:HTH-like domain